MTSCSHRFLMFVLVAVAAVLVASCGSREKRPEYYDYEEAPTLQVPEGLDPPSSTSALVIRSPYIPVASRPTQSVPPRISSTTVGADANARVHWTAEGVYLFVEDTPESVHRRLGLVIERSGMQRVREDDGGAYRFEYYQPAGDEEEGFFKKLAFWSRDKRVDYSGAYQAYVEADGENARIYIRYADGSEVEPDASQHLLLILGERLG